MTVQLLLDLRDSTLFLARSRRVLVRVLVAGNLVSVLVMLVRGLVLGLGRDTLSDVDTLLLKEPYPSVVSKQCSL